MGEFYYRPPDELYHYGVKGMKWGVRKQQVIGNNRRSSSQNVDVKARRKARLKTAAKVGAIVAGTALVAYGGYKMGKVYKSSIASLGKKYMNLGNTHYQIYNNNRNTAALLGNQADKKKLMAGHPAIRGNKADVDMYRNWSKDLQSTAREYDKRADKAFDDAANYWLKAKNNDYSKREIANELLEQLKKRR